MDSGDIICRLVLIFTFTGFASVFFIWLGYFIPLATWLLFSFNIGLLITLAIWGKGEDC